LLHAPYLTGSFVAEYRMQHAWALLTRYRALRALPTLRSSDAVDLIESGCAELRRNTLARARYCALRFSLLRPKFHGRTLIQLLKSKTEHSLGSFVST
jgi:hypothetical protein